MAWLYMLAADPGYDRDDAEAFARHFDGRRRRLKDGFTSDRDGVFPPRLLLEAPRMTILAWVLMAVGAFCSVFTLTADILKMRSHEPYVATGLWAPEIHVVLALLTGGGSWILWGWIAGAGVFVVHSAIGLVVGTKTRR